MLFVVVVAFLLNKYRSQSHGQHAGVLKNRSLNGRSRCLFLYLCKDEGSFIAHTHSWVLIPKKQARNVVGAGGVTLM